MSDSVRSPMVAVKTMTAPKMSPNHHGSWIMKIESSTPPTIATMTDPAKPSQVFFGLIRGAIGCFPKVSPEA